MILDDAINFLKKVPPFQFLDEAALTSIAGQLSMEFYPKDAVILKQGGPPSDSLRIIKKGGVKVSMLSEEGVEIMSDYRGEGDTFGFISLVGEARSRANVVAADDTICYLLEKESVLKFLSQSPESSEYLFRSYLTKYIDRTYKEMHNKSLLTASSDRLLFTTPVGDIATREVVTATGETTIQEAAQLMVRNRISSLIVVNGGNLPVGVVTDRDLREKVVAKGRDVHEPIRGIMSLPLIRVDARDYCFEAVLKMIRHGVHHVLVIKDGGLKGVLTNHDLMLLQGTSPLSFAKDIESQHTIERLVPVSMKIGNIVGLLMKEGARASNITKIISELNDRLVRKILEITEKKHGRPPVPYCWIVFGSEGRKEQTFRTDQDNALIYADPASPRQADEAKRYFADFAVSVRESLIKCGFPLCPADYMASNPLWNQPLSVWKKYFSSWITEPTPEALLKSLIFFDFRPLYGEPGLAEELRSHLVHKLEDEKLFLGYLANLIIKNTPPIGFLKTFVVEKSGEHKDELNLKIKGIAPLVDIARLFSLEKGVKETSTIERIEALRDKHTIAEEYADELLHAFDFIMLLRVQHQLEQVEAGKTPDNFINPDKLSNLEKKTIKDAFSVIAKIQELIAERYKAFIW